MNKIIYSLICTEIEKNEYKKDLFICFGIIFFLVDKQIWILFIITLLNLIKAIEIKRVGFELYALYVYEEMDMNLVQFKRQNKPGMDFCKQLHRFLVDYLKAAKEANFIHCDIKPRRLILEI